MQGSIKDFGVADILQLLSQQQKTGVLLVEHDKATVEVYFSNGDLVDIKSPKDTARFVAMLTKSSLATPEQLRLALEKQKNTFEPLCALLFKQGVLRKDDVEHITSTHTYELFYEILQWRKGTYRFVTQAVRKDEASAQLPGLESILLDVLRMIDEWPDIKHTISSFDLVFGKNNMTVEDLDADEERIYGLVDGKRSVQDIIDASMLGSFYACKALVSLLERGATRLLSQKASAQTDTRKLMLQTAFAVAACAVIVLALGLLVFLPGSLADSALPFASGNRIERSALKKAYVREKAGKLALVLEVYRLKNGTYPESMHALVEQSIVSGDGLAALYADDVEYAKRGLSFDITVRQ